MQCSSICSLKQLQKYGWSSSEILRLCRTVLLILIPNALFLQYTPQLSHLSGMCRCFRHIPDQNRAQDKHYNCHWKLTTSDSPLMLFWRCCWALLKQEVSPTSHESWSYWEDSKLESLTWLPWMCHFYTEINTYCTHIFTQIRSCVFVFDEALKSECV